MKLAILIAPLLLVACGSRDSEAVSAEKQYQLVADSGTAADKCAAAGRVADAWLKQENREKYDLWRSRRTADCTEAQLQASH
jgi:uncharacterized protein YcfL